mgnify:CR=1 FL=1
MQKISDFNDMSIKELRAYYGLTQAELSNITGIPKRTIGNWETGERKPAPYIVGLICAKLELKEIKSKS